MTSIHTYLKMKHSIRILWKSCFENVEYALLQLIHYNKLLYLKEEMPSPCHWKIKQINSQIRFLQLSDIFSKIKETLHCCCRYSNTPRPTTCCIVRLSYCNIFLLMEQHGYLEERRRNEDKHVEFGRILGRAQNPENLDSSITSWFRY